MSCSRTQHTGDASIIVFANLCCIYGDDNGGGGMAWDHTLLFFQYLIWSRILLPLSRIKLVR